MRADRARGRLGSGCGFTLVDLCAMMGVDPDVARAHGGDAAEHEQVTERATCSATDFVVVQP